jgi:hypothetical protein
MLAGIEALTDRFCEQHLDDEFRELCRSMAVALAQKGLSIESEPAEWAAGILSAIAWVNLLDEPGRPLHITAEWIARATGVSLTTLTTRACVIRDSLDLLRMTPRWSTQRLAEFNLLGWIEGR